MIYAAIFCFAVVRVFARAAQQLNVVNFKWLRVPFFSYLMAAGDFALWAIAASFVASRDWRGFVVAVLVYGTAGWVGAVVAMLLHRRTT